MLTESFRFATPITLCLFYTMLVIQLHSPHCRMFPSQHSLRESESCPWSPHQPSLVTSTAPHPHHSTTPPLHKTPITLHSTLYLVTTNVPKSRLRNSLWIETVSRIPSGWGMLASAMRCPVPDPTAWHRKREIPVGYSPQTLPIACSRVRQETVIYLLFKP